VLELFSHDRADARRLYRAFVRAGLKRSDPKQAGVGEIYLGDREFARRRSPRTRASKEVPRRQREPIRCSLEELLTSRGDGALAVAYREGYSLRELAAVLGVHYSTVSRRLRREERALGLA
jgi:putative transposase